MAENTYDIASARGAEFYPFLYSSADLADTFVFEAGDWGSYTQDNVLVDSVIHPEFDDAGVSQAGSWMVSVPLAHLATKSSAHIRWDGGDVAVEYTLNGTTWNVATNGMYIDLGVNPDLDIRVSFSGSVTDDDSQLTRMAVYVLATDTLFSNMSRRNIEFDNVGLSEELSHQDLLSDNDGAHIFSGGYMDIMPDTSDTVYDVNTVEFLARKNNSATATWLETTAGAVVITNTLISFPAAMSVWVDGAPITTGTFNITLNHWHHYRVQFTTENNNKIRLGISLAGTNPADMNIFGLANYPDVQAGNYLSSISTPTIAVDEVSSVNVSESATPYDIYAYVWSD